ncbi:hypothetical protein SUNI508_04514 [Seiridium unicorne]|uniref:Uncharacterized protein n=1 Tax=Seiridium unicorne TaxID=138068 RepID=A0ABR2V8G8_9PEZI
MSRSQAHAMSAASRRSSSVSSAEAARQRDLNKYYQPWLNSKKLRSVPVNTGPDEAARARCSHDATLTALAQLAALRLNVKRAMVSLIDTKTQIILAEATQTLSLVDEARHAPDDHIWLGNVSVPRHDCMDEHTFGAITTCQDSDGADVDLAALVVKDALDDARFRDRSYVTAKQGVRFYAGVPIVTKQGHSIGVYGVSDTRPRPQGLTLDEVQFMQDVAQIVAQHLDRVVDAMSRVSERDFMKGISYFLEDLSEFKYRLSNSSGYSMSPGNQNDSTDVQATDPQQEPSRGRQSQPNASSPNKSASASPHKAETSDEHEDTPGDVRPRFVRDNQSQSKSGPEPSGDNTRRIFTQATQLLCEQAKATGCVFVDAASGVFYGQPEQGSSPPGSVDPAASLNIDFDTIEGGRRDGDEAPNMEGPTKHPNPTLDDDMSQMARVLSMAFADDDCDSWPQGIVKRGNLKKCILRYPFGKCFYLNKGRVVADQILQLDEESTGGSMYEGMQGTLMHRNNMLPPELLACVPDAKWLIFLPLFNYAHSQWFAAGFIWGADFKMGDPDEALPFFKTFGSCMMSEVASMEVLNTNIAKSTFIASVSHDLRSPLHGMLGSLEFLEDTMTSAYQMSLVGSMETCGKTLLDTIDHLLDYAKINNLNRASTSLASPTRRKSSGNPSFVALTSQEASGSTSFDFSLLLEEVVEAVFAGQTFRKMNLRHHDLVNEATDHIKDMSLDVSTPAEEQIHAGSAKFSGRVCLVFNLEKSPSWCVQGQTGALRRVIMNVVGNAIKYCRSGFIEVLAKVKQSGLSDVEVELVVKDTGIGMSEDFMANHLFKAFSQEDSFTPGTGLGLSITSQILDNLGGAIRIHSEKGVGTHAHVTLPMKTASPGSCVSSQEGIVDEALKLTTGKKVCILNPMHDGGELEQAGAKLEASIISFSEGWFNMTCTKCRHVDDDPDASIYIYAEPPPIEHLVDQHHERIAKGQSIRQTALLIICTNAFEAAALRAAGVDHLISLGRIIEVVSQPVGLRKLAKVMLQCIKQVEASARDMDENENPSASSRTSSGGDIQRRAAEVRLNTVPVVYDQTALAYRPSIEAIQWKSDEPLRLATYVKTTAEEPVSTSSHTNVGGPSATTAMQEQGGSSKEETRPSPHVLLVDDNAINLRLLVTFMKKIQLPYAEASNGLEAFNKYKEAERPFDFVLMDLQMPIMDGFEATRKIREFEEEQGIAKASTIIAITGVGNEDARKEAVDAGMSRYLTKPVKFKELQQLLEQYKTSAQAINFILTLYVVVQVIVPAFFAPLADSKGRRPISLLTYSIYTAASLGLALNDMGEQSYVALLILRAVEALGASACASITYGVISDVCIPAERGTMVGPSISMANLGLVLGPVFGGVIAWRTGNSSWVFWALTLFGLVSVSLMLILLPETARSVVGNGGQGKRLKLVGLKRWILLGPDWSSTKYSKPSVDDERPYQPRENSDAQNLAPEKLLSRLRRIPNPLSCLSIMLWKDTGLITWLASCNYAVWYCVTASWPQIYTKIYGWNELTIGLAYLPSSITIIAAGFISGPWSNARYRRTAREAGLPVDSHRVDDFPIERARSRQQWPVFLVTHLGIAGLGWAIHERAHPAIPLTM